MSMSENVLGPSSPRSAFSVSLERLVFLAVAGVFGLYCQYFYTEILVGAEVFEYMGIRAHPVAGSMNAIFLALAVVPALWLPLDVVRPSDLPVVFIFYAVHIPTAVLLPLVSSTPTVGQFAYLGAFAAALLLLEGRRLLPAYNPPEWTLAPSVFWPSLGAVVVIAVILFLKSGFVDFADVEFFDVYGQRTQLKEQAGSLGPAFFYLATWTGGAIVPFLLVAGMHRRSLLVVLAGCALALVAFLASSSRATYMALPVVLGGYAFMRWSRGRRVSIWLGVAFLSLGLLLQAVDMFLVPLVEGRRVPLAGWTVFHRVFTNNGYLSSIYLDVFSQLEPAYYQDSFLRWLPGDRLPASIGQIAGASFTDVPDVNANANLWSNAYANLGYVGLPLTAFLAVGVFWIYDGIAEHRDFFVAVALLIVPASFMANTAFHNTLSTNGFIVTVVLLATWSGGRSRPIRRAL